MDNLWLILVFVTFDISAATTIRPSIPTGADFDKIVEGSFKNVDSDKDGSIEKFEYDNLVIRADHDNDGCLTLDEYKSCSPLGPEIATKLYKYYDISNTNCLRVDDASSPFARMDADTNGMVTIAEFRQYYVNLLQQTLHVTISRITIGTACDKIVEGSFKNVDSDKDGFIEKYELDNLVIVADYDNDGCLTLDEFKSFSAGGPEIATKIYTHFDISNTNCLRVDSISSQFAMMDADTNGMVTMAEFRQYYVNLLQTLHVTISSVC